MKQWLSENWLALYGSIVGTIALFINLSRLIHAIKKERVKLAISLGPHPEREKNIERLISTEKNQPWDDRPNLVEVYQLTIRNIGNVDAHIEDAGIVGNDGKVRQALIRYPGDQCLIGSIHDVGCVTITAKASKKISIYLNRGEDVFTAKEGFVIDSTGKKWTANA